MMEFRGGSGGRGEVSGRGGHCISYHQLYIATSCAQIPRLYIAHIPATNRSNLQQPPLFTPRPPLAPHHKLNTNLAPLISNNLHTQRRPVAPLPPRLAAQTVHRLLLRPPLLFRNIREIRRAESLAAVGECDPDPMRPQRPVEGRRRRLKVGEEDDFGAQAGQFFARDWAEAVVVECAAGV